MRISSGFGKVWRGSVAMLVSVALGFGYLTVEALPARAEGETVTIGDAGFASCLDTALSTTGSTFEVAALNGLTTLDCSNSGIADLTGAEHLSSATTLNFSSNSLRSVKALGSLASLESLNISGNQLVDLTPLSGASSLAALNASGQTAEWNIEREVATTVPFALPYGELPNSLVSSSPSLTFDSGKATGTVSGGFTITFSGNDYGDGWDFDGVVTTVVVSAPADVPDANFANCLTDKLGLVAGSVLNVGVLKTISSLNCDGRGIVDLTGAVYLDAASSLSFADNEIRTVAPIAGGGSLEATLDVSGNHIGDLSLLDTEFSAGIAATGQTLSWTIAPNVATTIPLKDYNGDPPTMESSNPTELVIADDLATGNTIGEFTITFTSDRYNGVFSGVLTTTVDAGEVTVPDDGLAACLQDRLGVSGKVFGSLALTQITGTLDCSSRGITDLSGAAYLTGLTGLNLSTNQLADVGPISGLTGLETLNLEANKLTGVAALISLTGLDTLNISYNQLDDISSLNVLGIANLDATGQRLAVTVEANTETALVIKDLGGATPTFALPAGVTIVEGNLVTAAAGIYDISFTSGDPVLYSGTLTLSAQMDVTFPDPNLASCVAAATGQSTWLNTFSNLDMAAIGDLSCAHRGVRDLTGLQYIPFLISVDLSRNAIVDVSALGGVPTLLSVDLSGNAVEDITALDGLTQLSILKLGDNQVSSLSALSEMDVLRVLEVGNNKLTSLKGVDSLPTLATLDASGNQLSSIAAAATLARLSALDVSDNQLTSVAELKDSTATTRLKTLKISNNRISSISTVSRFTRLNSLLAAGNKISDLTPITALTQLMEVDFANNQVSSLSGMAGHPILITADLSRNQITDVSDLAGLTWLKILKIYDNQIADLSGLSALPIGELDARDQRVSMTVIPQVATALPLKDQTGATATVGALPAGVSVADGQLTAATEGSYDVPFTSGDFSETLLEFSGTLKVTAAYNTFVTAIPTITGTPKVDATLTAHPGSWSPDPTAFTYQWKAAGDDISGATESSFTLTPEQVGKTISVVVTANKDTYASASSTSAATEQVTKATFTAPDEITVSGTFEVGQTITAASGTWTPNPTTLSYQWLRDGAAIESQTADNYTLTPADAGTVVTVQVSVTKDGYQDASLRSAAKVVALGVMIGDKPVIVGTAEVDQELTAGTGYWAPSPALSVQWYRAGQLINGATDYTYRTTAEDVGKAITVTQTGTADGYAALTLVSDPTQPVSAGSLSGPTAVLINGVAEVGQTLTADPGEWTPTQDSFSYQWYRDAAKISGATAINYLLTSADEGSVVSVEVTVAKAGYATATLRSEGGVTVAKGTFVTEKPVITGAAEFGQTLSATVDPWTPTANLAWQWLRDGSAISGATGSNYVLKADDIGRAISVKVTGTRVGYSNTDSASDPTAIVVRASFVGPEAVTVDGDLAVGQRLSVDHGAWLPVPDGFGYRWLRGGEPIAGAVSSSYTLVAADLGEVVTAEVTASKVGYFDSTMTSSAGAAVAASVFDAGVVTVSGNAVVGSTLTGYAGLWLPTPASLDYRWRADGELIADATGSTLELGAAQVGKKVTVEVTGSLGGYATKTVTSAATAAVAAATLDGPDEVAVSGGFVVGQTLTADAGSWVPAPDSVAYQWLRGAVEIEGATDATYALTAADEDKVVTVKATIAKAGYRTVVSRSVAAGRVVAADFVAETPTISGTVEIGQTLTAVAGSWTPEVSAHTYQWMRNGKAIEDATQATYQVELADASKKLSVAVTGAKAGYATTTVESAQTISVVPGTFTAPDSIAVTGDLRVGSTLTADHGSWSPSPSSYTYRWFSDGSAIDGATKASYTLVADDLGKVITVEVTAAKAGYSDRWLVSVNTTAVAKGSFVTDQPTISGQAQVGRVLTVRTGSWTPQPTIWTYQWLRNGEAISSQGTGSTYEPTLADVEQSISVQVTGSRDGYTTPAVLVSDPLDVAPQGHFKTPDVVEVRGEFAIGKTLTASAGEWTPAPKFAYQWLRSGAEISGATQATYTLQAADAGKVVTVKVTGTKEGYDPASVRSSAPSAVATGSFSAANPTISGTVKIGQTLAAKAGVWSPSPAKLSYQWFRSGVVIAKATAATYKVTVSDVGKKITVAVTGTRSGYAQAKRTSAATKVVPLGTLVGPVPVIKGKAKVKKTLKAVIGTWGPAKVTVKYQWYRSGKAIKKATKSSYKLRKADKRKRITVKVTVTKAGYATRVVTSKQSAKVK